MKPSGQRRIAPSAQPANRFAVIILLLALGGFGCQSLYHESRAAYSPDPEVRFKLRIAEAQQAERSAERAAVRLEERLAKHPPGPALAPDTDRLEMTALDLRRRVAALADAAAESAQAATVLAERQRLERRSVQLLEAVRLIRQEDPRTAAPAIQALLGGTDER